MALLDRGSPSREKRGPLGTSNVDTPARAGTPIEPLVGVDRTDAEDAGIGPGPASRARVALHGVDVVPGRASRRDDGNVTTVTTDGTVLSSAAVGVAITVATAPVTAGVTVASVEAAITAVRVTRAVADWSVCDADAGVADFVTFVTVVVVEAAVWATVVGTEGTFCVCDIGTTGDCGTDGTFGVWIIGTAGDCAGDATVAGGAFGCCETVADVGADAFSVGVDWAGVAVVFCTV